MLDKDTFKRELVRMWNTLRGDEYKGKGSCAGVYCEDCQLSSSDGCLSAEDIFEIYKIVEKWSKEHPPKKYKVSKAEYDILQEVYSAYGNFRMYQNEIINNLREKGYFKGSHEDTEIDYYLKNCEVSDDV